MAKRKFRKLSKEEKKILNQMPDSMYVYKNYANPLPENFDRPELTDAADKWKDE